MGYNQKHAKSWDENLIYIQHSYNIVSALVSALLKLLTLLLVSALLKLAMGIFHLFPWML